MTSPADQQPFHVMAKPSGAACNLACEYCFFRKKERLYPQSNFRMSDEVLESYIRQVIECETGPEVTVAWQGGEPTLMGLDFYRKAVAIERKHLRPGQKALNTFQTNGVLLDDDWCRFLHDHGFLVGLSLDGPRELHDAYRKDRAGNSVFAQVMRAAELMRRHKVEFNILCAVHAVNGDHPLEVYRFLRDEAQARFIQLIPIVERDNPDGNQQGDTVMDRSIRPEQFGRFLIAIFDEWVRRDVGRVFVITFDSLLAAWLYGSAGACVFRPTCGQALALEHNGDLYCCDHFVEPGFLLGNILKTPLADLARSEAQRRFGQAKADTLPGYCRQCEFLFACNGECPKNRTRQTPDGEPGLNYLCAGYKAFFRHVDQPMRTMADLLRRGRQAEEIMKSRP